MGGGSFLEAVGNPFGSSLEVGAGCADMWSCCPGYLGDQLATLCQSRGGGGSGERGATTCCFFYAARFRG